MKTNPFLFLRLFFFDYSMRNCNDGHYSVHLPMIMVCVDCVWLLLSIAQKILVYGCVRASLSELMCTLIPCSHRHHHLFWFDVNKKRKQILIGSSWLRPANRQPIIHYRVSRSCVECPSPPHQFKRTGRRQSTHLDVRRIKATAEQTAVHEYILVDCPSRTTRYHWFLCCFWYIFKWLLWKDHLVGSFFRCTAL